MCAMGYKRTERPIHPPFHLNLQTSILRSLLLTKNKYGQLNKLSWEIIAYRCINFRKIFKHYLDIILEYIHIIYDCQPRKQYNKISSDETRTKPYWSRATNV